MAFACPCACVRLTGDSKFGYKVNKLPKVFKTKLYMDIWENTFVV